MTCSFFSRNGRSFRRTSRGTGRDCSMKGPSETAENNARYYLLSSPIHRHRHQKPHTENFSGPHHFTPQHWPIPPLSTLTSRATHAHPTSLPQHWLRRRLRLRFRLRLTLLRVYLRFATVPQDGLRRSDGLIRRRRPLVRPPALIVVPLHPRTVPYGIVLLVRVRVRPPR